MSDTRKLFELYDLMERNLEELGLSFDEFTVLYKTFRGTSQKEEPKENPNPFPWLQAAGTGYS